MPALHYSFGIETARSIPDGVKVGAVVQTNRAPKNAANIDFSYRTCVVVDIRPDAAEVEVEMIDGFWAGQRVWMFAENCEIAASLDGGPVATSANDVRSSWEFVNPRLRNETANAYAARFERYFETNYRAFQF